MNDFKHFRGRGRGQYQHNNFRGGNFNNRRGNPNNYQQMLHPPHFRDNNKNRWQRPQHSGWRGRHPPPLFSSPGGHGSPQSSFSSPIQGPPQNSFQNSPRNCLLPPQPNYNYPPPKNLIPPRPSSPLPGSEEARQKAIAEASARIKQQLNLETEKPESFLPNNSNEQILAPTITSFNDGIFSNFDIDFTADCDYVPEIPKQEKYVKKKVKKDAISNKSVEELRNKILNQFTTMSKGKIQSLVNNPGSSKYDNYLHHLVRDMRLHLSSELRNMYNNRENDSNMIDHFNSIVPDLGVELVNLPDTMVAELSKILQVDVNEGQIPLDSMDDQNCPVNSADDTMLIEPEDMFKQAEKLLLNTNLVLDSTFEVNEQLDFLDNTDNQFLPDSSENFLQNNLENLQNDPFINRSPLCNEPPPNVNFIPEPSNLTNFSIPQGSFTPDDNCQNNFLNENSNFTDYDSQINELNVQLTTPIDYTSVSCDLTPMIGTDLLETADMDIDTIVDQNLSSEEINLDKNMLLEQDPSSILGEIPLPDSNQCQTDSNQYQTDLNQCQTDSNQFQTDSNQFQTDSNQFQTDSNQFQTDSNQFQTDSNNFQTNSNQCQAVLNTPICSRESSPFSKKLLEVNLLPDSSIIEPNCENNVSQNEINDTLKSLTGKIDSQNNSPSVDRIDNTEKNIDKDAVKFDFESVWVFKPKDNKLNVTSFLDDVTSQNKCEPTKIKMKTNEQTKLTKPVVRPTIRINFPKNLPDAKSKKYDMTPKQKRVSLDERIRMMMKMQDKKDKKGEEKSKSEENRLLKLQQQQQNEKNNSLRKKERRKLIHQKRLKLLEENKKRAEKLVENKAKLKANEENRKVKMPEGNKMKIKVCEESEKPEKKYLNKFQEKIIKMTPNPKSDSNKYPDLDPDVVIKQENIDSQNAIGENISCNSKENIQNKNINSPNISSTPNITDNLNICFNNGKKATPKPILEARRVVVLTKGALKDLPPLNPEKSKTNLSKETFPKAIIGKITEKNKSTTEDIEKVRKVEYRSIPGIQIKRKEKSVEKEFIESKNNIEKNVEIKIEEESNESVDSETLVSTIRERKNQEIQVTEEKIATSFAKVNKPEIQVTKEKVETSIAKTNKSEKQVAEEKVESSAAKIIKPEMQLTEEKVETSAAKMNKPEMQLTEEKVEISAAKESEIKQNIPQSMTAIVSDAVQNKQMNENHETTQKETSKSVQKENAKQDKINEKISKKFDNIFKEMFFQKENKHVEKSCKIEPVVENLEKEQPIIEHKILEEQISTNNVENIPEIISKDPESTENINEPLKIVVESVFEKLETKYTCENILETQQDDSENKDVNKVNETTEVSLPTHSMSQSNEGIKNVCEAAINHTALSIESVVNKPLTENNASMVCKEKAPENIKEAPKEVKEIKKLKTDDKTRDKSCEKDSKKPEKSERSSVERSHKNDRHRHHSKEKDKPKEKYEHGSHKNREKSLSKEPDKSDRHRDKKESHKSVSKSDKKSESSQAKKLNQIKPGIDENIKIAEVLLRNIQTHHETVNPDNCRTDQSKVFQRLFEIDLQVQKLMSEKFELYKRLNASNIDFNSLSLHPPVLPKQISATKKSQKDAETSTAKSQKDAGTNTSKSLKDVETNTAKSQKDAETNTEVEEVKRPISTTPSEATTRSTEMDLELNDENVHNKKNSKSSRSSKTKRNRIIDDDSDVELNKRLRKRKIASTPPLQEPQNTTLSENVEDDSEPPKKRSKYDRKSESKRSAKLSNKDSKNNSVIENRKTSRRLSKTPERTEDLKTHKKPRKTPERTVNLKTSRKLRETPERTEHSKTNKKRRESPERIENLKTYRKHRETPERTENLKTSRKLRETPERSETLKTSRKLRETPERTEDLKTTEIITEPEEATEKHEKLNEPVKNPELEIENVNKNVDKSSKRRKKMNVHNLSEDMIDEPNKKFFIKIKKPDRKSPTKNIEESMEVDAQMSSPISETIKMKIGEPIVQIEKIKIKKYKKKLQEVEPQIEEKTNENTNLLKKKNNNHDETIDKEKTQPEETVEKNEEHSNDIPAEHQIINDESENKIKFKIIKSTTKSKDNIEEEIEDQTDHGKKEKQEENSHSHVISPTPPPAPISKSKNSKRKRRRDEETRRSRSRSASKETELKDNKKDNDTSDIEEEILANRVLRKNLSDCEEISSEDRHPEKKIKARRKRRGDASPIIEVQKEEDKSPVLEVTNEDKSSEIDKEDIKETQSLVESKNIIEDCFKKCFVKLERIKVNKEISEEIQTDDKYEDTVEDSTEKEEIDSESIISNPAIIEDSVLEENIQDDLKADISNEEVEYFKGYDISENNTIQIIHKKIEEIGKADELLNKNIETNEDIVQSEETKANEKNEEDDGQDKEERLVNSEEKIEEVTIEKLEHKESSELEEGIFCTGHKKSILDIKIIGNEFLAASEDGTIYKYSLISGELEDSYTGHKRAVTCINTMPGTALDLDSIIMYSGSLDCTLKCFNVDTSEILDSVKVEQAIQCMDIAWGYIFLGTYEGLLFIYNIKKKLLNDQSLTIANATVLMIKATTEGSRQVLILASRKREIMVRDAFTGLLLRTMCQDQKPTIYSLLLDKSRVYCGTSDKGILVLDFNNGVQTNQYNSGKGVVCVVMYKTLLFAGCYDGLIYIYNTKTNKHIMTISGPGEGMLLSLAIHDGLIIAGTKKDHLLKIWKIPQEILNEI